MPSFRKMIDFKSTYVSSLIQKNGLTLAHAFRSAQRCCDLNTKTEKARAATATTTDATDPIAAQSMR